MIKTDTVNLDWAAALLVLFAALLISLIRSHTKAFRLKILLIAADLCGIIYFMFGEYAALALSAASVGLVLSFAGINRGNN